MKDANSAGVLATMSPPCWATTDLAPSVAAARIGFVGDLLHQVGGMPLGPTRPYQATDW